MITSVDIPREYTNVGIAEWLMSPECTDAVLDIAVQAQFLYAARVAHKTGNLSHSGRISIIQGGRRNDRWVAALTYNTEPGSGREYAMAHEAYVRKRSGIGDWPQVIQALKGASL
ncbi:hypothetical protein [Tsukamurella soli]|uniref:Bacteriophage HK97-gp10, tail-component n=1 Tax=Tsukamurella soli TaxID=644556 RepID=A0ABP8K2Z9_9ACTN